MATQPSLSAPEPRSYAPKVPNIARNWSVSGNDTSRDDVPYQ